MSFVEGQRIYRSLDHEQKRFLAEKLIEGTRTADEWLSLLGPLAEYDRHGDAVRSVLKKAGCISALAFLACLYLGVVVGLWMLFVIMLIIAIVGVTIFTRQFKEDLPDNFRKFVVPLISILREEMEPDQALYLRLDFRGGEHKEKQVVRGQSPTTQGKETYFVDTWIAGKTSLADDSRLEWEVADNIRRRQITKRRSSKVKTKVKHKIKTLIDVRLGPSAEHYTPADTGGASEGMQTGLKLGEKRSTVRVRRVIVSRQLGSVLNLDDFVAAIAEGYRRVTQIQGSKE
jgi:hypothetical protein